jgi:dihydrofolate reductase
MAKIYLTTNMSLDGVVDDPDGAEGFERGGWYTKYGAADLEPWRKLLEAESFATDALLLGRRTDEWFGTRWVGRDGAWADRLNGLPKYVVSSSLDEPKWTNVTVLRGDVVDEVTRLKHELDGQIGVFASYELMTTLLDHDLVDELRLFVFPVVVGAGRRLFGETSTEKPIQLVDSQRVGDGLLLVTYELVHGE